MEHSKTIQRETNAKCLHPSKKMLNVCKVQWEASSSLRGTYTSSRSISMKIQKQLILVTRLFSFEQYLRALHLRLELGDIGLLQHLTLHTAKQGHQIRKTIHTACQTLRNKPKRNVGRYLLHLGLGDEGLGDALEAVVEDLRDRGGDRLRLLGRHALRLQLPDLRPSRRRERARTHISVPREAFRRTPLRRNPARGAQHLQKIESERDDAEGKLLTRARVSTRKARRPLVLTSCEMLRAVLGAAAHRCCCGHWCWPCRSRARLQATAAAAISSSSSPTRRRIREAAAEGVWARAGGERTGAPG